MKLFADFFSGSGSFFWMGYYMLLLTLPLSIALTLAAFLFRKLVAVFGGKLVQLKQKKRKQKQEEILDGK